MELSSEETMCLLITLESASLKLDKRNGIHEINSLSIGLTGTPISFHISRLQTYLKPEWTFHSAKLSDSDYLCACTGACCHCTRSCVNSGNHLSRRLASIGTVYQNLKTCLRFTRSLNNFWDRKLAASYNLVTNSLKTYIIHLSLIHI